MFIRLRCVSTKTTNVSAGKIERVQVIMLPPLLFIAGIAVYNAYLWISPPAFLSEKTERVEALEVISRISPHRQNGLAVAQAEPLRGGGSSRVAVTRPAADGAFLLARGAISYAFLMENIQPDKMLHVKLLASDIRVESEGQPVEAVVLLPRHETTPMKIAGISLVPDESVFDRLFSKPTILPVPKGKFTGGSFVSDNGMKVDTGLGSGGGFLAAGGLISLDVTLDSLSSAWVELPKTHRIQSMVVGGEDLEIGFLIAYDGDLMKSYQVQMFGQQIANIVPRPSGN